MTMTMTVNVHQKCEHFGLDLGLATAGLEYIQQCSTFQHKSIKNCRVELPKHIM